MTKPILHFDVKETRHIDYGDLEAFYTKHYPTKEKYSFVAVEECGNDSSHEFKVTGKLKDYDKEDYGKVRDGYVPTYRNSLLLNVLCADGYLPAGDYVIRVSW